MFPHLIYLSYLSSHPEGLLYGNLLCISLDGYFQEPVWAIVERHIVEQRFGAFEANHQCQWLTKYLVQSRQETKNKMKKKSEGKKANSSLRKQLNVPRMKSVY